MKIHRCKQASDEWLALRCGLPTASNFSQIVTPAKGELSKSRTKYIDELIADRITGPPIDGGAYTSRAMDYGSVMEADARQYYREHHTRCFEDEVEEVGFITDDEGRFGVSPDGNVVSTINPNGGLELKVPLPKTHVGWWRAGVLPIDHKCQVHGGLAVTGYEWWDFMSYCPGIPPFIIRVKPDDFTKLLLERLIEFSVELESEWTRIKALLPKPEPVDTSHPF